LRILVPEFIVAMDVLLRLAVFCECIWHVSFFCVDVCLLKGGFFGWILIFIPFGYIGLGQSR
jgi:hypothetical protein